MTLILNQNAIAECVREGIQVKEQLSDVEEFET